MLKNRILRRFGKSSTRLRTLLTFIDGSDQVLDIGCVQHDLDQQDWRDPPKYEWLHADLVRTAASVRGIDMLADEVQRMRDAGYDAIVADAEDFDLGERYDVIVAGELIEHLSNPGQFLACCSDHLKADGRLILSTPNPVSLEKIIWHIRGEHSERINDEHTAWYDPAVLSELSSREGFIIARRASYSSGIFPLSAFFLRRLDVCEPLHAGGYIYELRQEG